MGTVDGFELFFLGHNRRAGTHIVLPLSPYKEASQTHRLPDKFPPCACFLFFLSGQESHVVHSLHHFILFSGHGSETSLVGSIHCISSISEDLIFRLCHTSSRPHHFVWLPPNAVFYLKAEATQHIFIWP